MRAVKWWSSNNYPHHNIEIQLSINGRPWAIAHIKWKDRSGPTTTNVLMATFKASNGDSIPNGNFYSGTTRICSSPKRSSTRTRRRCRAAVTTTSGSDRQGFVVDSVNVSVRL